MRQSERLPAITLVIAVAGCDREVSTATPDVERPALAKAAAPTPLSQTTGGAANAR
jgi:hypothetical protein